MKKWLFIILSMGLLSSCIEGVMVAENEEDSTATTGNLSVYLQNPVTTRSAWEYDDYFPNSDIFHDDSKEERLLHNLSIAYFDSDFILEHFSTTVDHFYTHPYSSDIYAGYTAEDNKEYSVFTLGIGNLPMTTGAHYFYIICILPHDYLLALKDYCMANVNSLTKDEFEKIVVDDDEQEYGIEEVTRVPYEDAIPQEGNYQFRRCLMTNIVSPAPHYMADKSLIVGSASYPSVNGIGMEIGKSFAKVSVAYIPQQTTGTLSDIQYRIANDPQRMYLFPNIFSNQVYTPHYDQLDKYPDFKTYFNAHFNPYLKILKDENEINPKADTPNDFSWRNASTKETTTFAYCMENGNEIPLQGNSTVVLVKAKYTPEEWLNPDGTQGNPGADGTFWRIRNSAGNYLSGYYNAEPYVSSARETVKYEGGITYYPVWLQTDGKYMVERNHYYKIAITEVTSAGAPDLASVISPEVQLTDSSTKTRSAASGELPEALNGIRWEQNN